MNVKVLKITDQDDFSSDPIYTTINRLRDQVLNEWYDMWVEKSDDIEITITKDEIKESDEKLFDFMNEWGFNVEFILTITEQDL